MARLFSARLNNNLLNGVSLAGQAAGSVAIAAMTQQPTAAPVSPQMVQAAAAPDAGATAAGSDILSIIRDILNVGNQQRAQLVTFARPLITAAPQTANF